MKFTITTPNGTVKNRETNNQEEIRIFLKRGWKEVPSDKPTVKKVKPKANGGKLIKSKTKKAKKKK